LNYHIPRPNRIFRFIFRPVFRAIFYLLAKVNIDGMENIPDSGSYIITINHVSLFEPPFVMAFWPVAPEGVGASDLWDRTGQSILVRLYGGIPVRRTEFDRQVFKRVMEVIEDGRPLVIAPEGGRSHQPGMRRARPGIAYIVDLADVPVLPVGIRGATDDFLKKALQLKRPQITMKIGHPFKLEPIRGKGEQKRDMRQANADRIMVKIAQLLPEQYWGVYSPQGLRRLNQEQVDD
jgi:1-acyl-sn-glycerol-3-phosphate acyltransferase